MSLSPINNFKYNRLNFGKSNNLATTEINNDSTAKKEKVFVNDCTLLGGLALLGFGMIATPIVASFSKIDTLDNGVPVGKFSKKMMALISLACGLMSGIVGAIAMRIYAKNMVNNAHNNMAQNNPNKYA